MAIFTLFTDASSAMTVVSLITFLGILWWTFGLKRSADFDAVANLPFADDIADAAVQPAVQSASQRSPDSEKHHG